jgi:hypothetical protein
MSLSAKLLPNNEPYPSDLTPLRITDETPSSFNDPLDAPPSQLVTTLGRVALMHPTCENVARDALK